jgi:hypothetical protein
MYLTPHELMIAESADRPDAESWVAAGPAPSWALSVSYCARRALFTSHPVLSFLSTEELDHVLGYVIAQRYEAGEVMFRKGDAGQSMMLIAAGKVKISTFGPDGREAVLAVLGEGEILARWPSSTTSRAAPMRARSRLATCWSCASGISCRSWNAIRPWPYGCWR